MHNTRNKYQVNLLSQLPLSYGFLVRLFLGIGDGGGRMGLRLSLKSFGACLVLPSVRGGILFVFIHFSFKWRTRGDLNLIVFNMVVFAVFP